MKTRAELEAELGEAADRLRRVNKAAKDQAARSTGEPTESLPRLPSSLSPPIRPSPPQR